MSICHRRFGILKRFASVFTGAELVLKRIAMAKHGHPGYMLSVTFFSVCAVAISAWIAFLIWVAFRLIWVAFPLILIASAVALPEGLR